MTYIEKIQSRIADIEARMGREWRLYQSYSDYLLRLKAELDAKLRYIEALRLKRLRALAPTLWRQFERTCARLEWFAHIRRLRDLLPGSYSWGVDDPSQYSVIEE